MQLLAAEPPVTDPVAAADDEDGRLYVCEMNDDPYVDPAHDQPFAENLAHPPLGRIRLRIDRDGDGRFGRGIGPTLPLWPSPDAISASSQRPADSRRSRAGPASATPSTIGGTAFCATSATRANMSYARS